MSTKLQRINERKTWTKFEDCTGILGPEESVTFQSNEIINLNLNLKNIKEERDDTSQDKINVSSIVVCRNCGETGHWTLKCPKQVNIKDTKDTELTKNKYVPIHLKENKKENKNPIEGYSLKITNLSKETNEDDLINLFGRFGNIRRIFIAKNFETKISRGFAFITFSRKWEGQNAIDKLNKYGYDNLILQVEWADHNKND